MAFRLKRSEGVGKGVRRIVRGQIDNALASLRAPEGTDEAVHDARKCFKRVRAVLRLVRDGLGGKAYRRENACFRDAGRPLIAARDAKALVEAFDMLTKDFSGQPAAGAFSGVRQALQAKRQAVNESTRREDGAFATVTETVEAAHNRLGEWEIRPKGWSALRSGLKREYKRGRRALAVAAADPTVENLHEWRKQAKYLWHQLQVLDAVWSRGMDELGHQVEKLAQLLGDEHDLALLHQTVTTGPGAFEEDSTREALLALIGRRREELRQEAFGLGRGVYRDRPRVFTNRIKGLWKAWRTEATLPA